MVEVTELKALDALEYPWRPFCGLKSVTVVIHYSSKGGIERRVVVCSDFFQSDAEESPPSQQVRDLIRDCDADGLDLVIGCDVKAHLMVWRNSD